MTLYLFRLYAGESGYREVRALVNQPVFVVSPWHARPKFASTILRKRRETYYDEATAASTAEQFHLDREAGLIGLLPLTDSIAERLEAVLESAPATTNLRAADALHLACAAEHGFSEIYSNDRRFLEAAPLFGLKGVNVIP